MNCPNCHNQEGLRSAIRAYEKGGRKIEYYFCPACELVFHDEHIPGDYYNGQYRAETSGSTDPTEKVAREQRERARMLTPFLKMLIAMDSNMRRAIDIGSSTGELLKRLDDLGFAELVGIEPGEAYTRECGYITYPSIEAEITERGGQYDLATCIHTLEHMDDMNILDKINARILLLEVPNLFTAPKSAHYSHRICFTDRSLYNTLARHGWNPIVLLPHFGTWTSVWAMNLICIATKEAADPLSLVIWNTAAVQAIKDAI